VTTQIILLTAIAVIVVCGFVQHCANRIMGALRVLADWTDEIREKQREIDHKMDEFIASKEN
jgi:hypothetical protein